MEKQIIPKSMKQMRKIESSRSHATNISPIQPPGMQSELIKGMLPKH